MESKSKFSTFKENWKGKSPRSYKVVSFIGGLCLQYWFYVGLAIFIVIARFAPNFARHGGLIRAEYTIGYLAVAIIFFGSGLSMNTKALMKNMGNWRAHVTVFLLQYLITSAIIFGFCCAIKRANNPQISNWMLFGLIVTACCPTTVASNVIMTRKADGNELLTLCEVFLGNLSGAFITPALVQMFALGEWSFANPANGNSVGDVYRNVIKQVGCSVFVPVFIGQVLQNVFPKQVKWFLVTFKFNKVGSFMLLLIMFSSFSTAFYQHAFTAVSHECIILICFFNFGIYLLFTVICFLMSRMSFLKIIFADEPDPAKKSKLYIWGYKILLPFYYNREDTVSIMLCGGAKTAALGVSLISSQYGSDNPHLGELLVPLVLYQAEQVLAANVLTDFMKKWVHEGPEWKAQQAEKEFSEAEKSSDEEKDLGSNQEPPNSNSNSSEGEVADVSSSSSNNDSDVISQQFPQQEKSTSKNN